MTGILRANNVKRYLRSMNQRGFSTDAVLKDAGIDVGSLDDPECLIETFQCQKVISNMLALTGDSGLGLEVGSELSYSDLGIVGYLMASAPMVGAASRLWTKYSHLLVGIPIEVALHEGGHPWHFIVSDNVGLESVFVFCVDELLVTSKRIGDKIAGVESAYDRLDFSFSPPPHHARYKEMFNCPVRFNQPVCKLSVRSPRLDTQLIGHDSLINEIYLSYCSRQLRMINANSALLARIRAILVKSRGAIPSEDEIAQKLHYSTRNLRRLLHMEDLSYRQIVNDFRCELAKEYVATSFLSSQEISYLLGYKENKSFLRAFKAWTGTTVGEYREWVKSKLQEPERLPTAA